MYKQPLGAKDKMLLLAIHECWPETPLLSDLHVTCEMLIIPWEPGILKNLLDNGLIGLSETRDDGEVIIKATTKGRMAVGLLIGSRTFGFPLESYL